MSGDEDFLAGLAVAVETAAKHADEVDRDARFPVEAVDALRACGALSALVPTALGGPAVSMTAVAQGCGLLARSCSATAMVFAMHQIQVAVLVTHTRGEAWFDDYLRRLVAEQRLIGSVTSEVTTGGDMSRSTAAVEPAGDGRVRFTKQAPTCSYGAHADDLLTTLRRAEEADPTDQVLVLTSREQHELAFTGTWDPLGMRGTCSPGFTMTAEAPAEQVMAVGYGDVAADSMVPVSHVLWAHVWTGIALEAFHRARSFVRAAARRTGEPGMPGRRLSELSSDLGALRSEVEAVTAHFEAAQHDRSELRTMAAVLRYNNLKVLASESSSDICLRALNICGIAGFKNDTPFSVGRHLRDSLSGAVMVNNDRLHETNARLLLVVKDVR